MRSHINEIETRRSIVWGFVNTRVISESVDRNEFESVGGAPVRSDSGGVTPAGNFFCHAPPFFGSKSTISRFGERFRDGQYSLVGFLFAVLLTVPPCPMESAPLVDSVRQ